MEVYVARQTIFNRRKETYGYELLFRNGMSNVFPDIDGDTATSKLLSNSFFSIGIDHIIGGKLGFINFTEDLLIKKVPLMLPKNKIFVEILEDVNPTEEVISACREIAGNGYEIALDDFFYRSDLEPLISLAGIIKIDLRMTSIEESKDIMEKLALYHVKFLAEKVETYEEFQQALDIGFEYFQGYFFSKPQILKGRDISPSEMNLLQIVAEANKEDIEFDELEKLVSRDVSISYKLLRYIKSAHFKRVREISSIKQAIVFLGEKETRRFISLIALANLASDKPDELIRVSIIRAKLCELIGKESSLQIDQSELFTIGLFSLIDAILDDSIEHLMDKLPLSERIKHALVDGTGALADYLSLASSYETADWQEVSRIAAKIGINEEIIPEFYRNSVVWADSLVSS